MLYFWPFEKNGDRGGESGPWMILSRMMMMMMMMMMMIIIIIIMGICNGISTKWLLIHCFIIELEFRSVGFCRGRKTGEP